MIPAWLTGLAPVAKGAGAILLRAIPLMLVFAVGFHLGTVRELGRALERETVMHEQAIEAERALRAELADQAEAHAQRASEVAYKMGVETTMAAARRAVATAKRDARVETIVKEVHRVRVECPKDDAGKPDPDRGRLSGQWRVLHDAAIDAANADLPQAAAHAPDRPLDLQAGAPVDPATALDTVIHNYSVAAANADTLTACQQSMRAVIAACWATTLTAAQEGESDEQEISPSQ